MLIKNAIEFEMKQRNIILGIDIQNDFTQPSGSLYVKGADADVRRMATFLEENGSSIDDVVLTVDSHQPIHIANQVYWKDREGYPPALFTVISAKDVEEGKWKPQFNEDIALDYLRELEQTGEVCTIWPPHCIIGSKGWAINEVLIKALYSWSINERRSYELFYKGSNQATEHYSIFKAAVEYPDAEETWLNRKLLDKLRLYDRIIVFGEAADYCVSSSLRDMIHAEPELASKTVVFTDCMSWIEDDNQRAKYIYEQAEQKGVSFMLSSEFRY